MARFATCSCVGVTLRLVAVAVEVFGAVIVAVWLEDGAAAGLDGIGGFAAAGAGAGAGAPAPIGFLARGVCGRRVFSEDCRERPFEGFSG